MLHIAETKVCCEQVAFCVARSRVDCGDWDPEGDGTDDRLRICLCEGERCLRPIPCCSKPIRTGGGGGGGGAAWGYSVCT